MAQSVLEKIIEGKIIAIVRGIPSTKILGLASALERGGVSCIEVTFDQTSEKKAQDTLASIRVIREELGITMLTAGLTVFLRDLEYILGIVTMAWMYITPIMYPESIVPEKYRVIFSLNPITPIIRCYRSVLYYKETPKLLDMGMSLLIALVILVVGNVVFGKVQRRFAEEL